MPRLFDNGYRVEPPLNNDIPKCIEFHLTQSSCIIYLSEQLKLDLDLIVLNCTLATVENVVQCDVGVKDEKVHSIVLQGSLVGLKAKRIIDAKGALVTVSFFLTSVTSELSPCADLPRSQEELMPMFTFRSRPYLDSAPLQTASSLVGLPVSRGN